MNDGADTVESMGEDIEVIGVFCFVSPKDGVGDVIGELNAAERSRGNEKRRIDDSADRIPLSSQTAELPR